MAASMFPVPLSGIQTSTLTTTGDTLYASAANSPARLGIGSTGQVLTVASGLPSWATPSTTPVFAGCLLTAVTQAISTGTDTVVSWAGEVFDTDAYHSTSSNTSRITIPTGKSGYYLFTYNGVWEDSATGAREVRFRKNGTVSTQVFQYVRDVAGGYFSQQFTTIASATAGDYFEVQVTQASGGTKQLYGDSGVGNLPGLRFGCSFLGA